MSYAFGGFLLLIFSGMPIVFALGVSALLAIVLMTDAPLVIVAQRVYCGINSFQLLAIPFFVAAGIIMVAGGIARRFVDLAAAIRSEEHTSELQSLMRISYAAFCLKHKKNHTQYN